MKTFFRKISKRHAIRLIAICLLAVVLGFGLYACSAQRALRNEIANTPRDPATGVVIGTEAIDLDPPAGADRPTTACLLVHGFIGSRIDFADLGERLAERGFHVRMMRLPGHGTTPPEFAEQTPETLLDAVEVEFDALRAQYEAVNVIGFSMGGALVTLLAARHDDIDRLVLVAPYYGVTYLWYYVLPAETWNVLFSPIIPYVVKPEWGTKVNRREALKEIYTYKVVPTKGARLLMQLGRRARNSKILAEVQCPVLLVMAEGDEAASPWRARRVFEEIPSADKREAWFSEKSNHQLLWDYDREEAKAAILEFLCE